MKTALHTVSYAGVWRGQARLSLGEVIAKAGDLGFDGLMLMAKRPHASLLDMDVAARAQTRGAIEKRGLQLACLACYNDFSAGADHLDVPLREIQVHYLNECARLCADLGGAMIRVFTAFQHKEASLDQQWAWCVEGLREASQRAADLGVTVAVQNHHDVANHHLAMAALIDEVGEPNCKAAFDAWAAALQGADLAEAVRCLGDRIAYTTVADYVRLPWFRYVPDRVSFAADGELLRAVPVGEGFIPYGEFFAALKEIGYDGWVAYEMCSPLRGGGDVVNLDRCAKRFVDWIRAR